MPKSNHTHHSGGKSFPLIATLFTLSGVGILVSLGLWQIERLQWKEQIIQAVEKELEIKAQERPIDKQMIMKAARDPYPYLRGYVQGKYIQDASPVLIKPRTSPGPGVGAHLVDLFELEESGLQIMVNRGWVPADMNNESSEDLKTYPTDSQKHRLIGHFKAVETPSALMPDNRPDKDMWTHIDPEDLRHYWNKGTLAPLVLYLESHNTHNNTDPPIGFDKYWMPYNKHMQYAIFWFSMAGILLAIYYLRFIRPLLKSSGRQ